LRSIQVEVPSSLVHEGQERDAGTSDALGVEVLDGTEQFFGSRHGMEAIAAGHEAL
jgi:hypothetical protein